MRVFGVAAAAAAVLTACVPALELNEPVAATVTSRAESQFQTAPFTIRSYTLDAEGEAVEFAGAVCSGRSRGVSFRNVATPAVIVAPTYLQAERFADRGRPAPLRITCRANGETITFDHAASDQRGNGSSTVGGVYNASSGTYGTATITSLDSRLSSTLPWYYPPVRVEF